MHPHSHMLTHTLCLAHTHTLCLAYTHTRVRTIAHTKIQARGAVQDAMEEVASGSGRISLINPPISDQEVLEGLEADMQVRQSV